MLLLLPVLVGIAVVIGLDSSGPILYKGLRVGRRGQRFKILKFRITVVVIKLHFIHRVLNVIYFVVHGVFEAV